MIREFVLQLKKGSLGPPYFAEKYGVDVLERFASRSPRSRATAISPRADADRIALTRDGLLRVDVLLPASSCRSTRRSATPDRRAMRCTRPVPTRPRAARRRAARVRANGLAPSARLGLRRGPAWRRRRPSAIAPDDIPSPYRSLLVHQRDMTLTLEAHFGGRVVLRPLSTFTRGGWYYRRVLLAQEYSGRPVEMGAIRIKLGAFAAAASAPRSCRNAVPLGRILRDGGVDFTSRAARCSSPSRPTPR